MRNFLNTTFKFLSRSLVITGVFLLFFSHATVAQAPRIIEFKTSSTEVQPDGNWTLTWNTVGFAGCSLDAPDLFLSKGGMYSPNNSVTLDDASIGEYTYNLECYTTLRTFRNTGDAGLIYTAQNPVPQTTNTPFIPNRDGYFDPNPAQPGIKATPITITVVDVSNRGCIDSSNPELCSQMCTAYGADAASCKTCKTGDAEKCETFANKCLIDGQKPTNQSPADQDTCTTPNINEAEEQGGIDKTPVAEECSGLSIFSGACIANAARYLIDTLILPLFTGFVRLSSMIFEVSVYIGIVKFSELIGGDSGSSWITAIWGTIRDILNIGVIFVLLYAAINVIVGRGGEIKKLIAGVILFGVMTNFSLFLTKAAIDVANVVALEFYNQMRTEDSIHTIAFDRGVGATIVEVTKLTRFYTAPSDVNGSTNGAGGVANGATNNQALKDSFLFRFTMIIVFIAVGFVFLQAAGIFIARTVSLIFLLIFSPLMFAGGIFTPLQKWISRWHEEFLGQTILAPIFFILLYVALTILNNVVVTLDAQLKTIDESGGNFFLSTTMILISSVLVIFSFALVITKTKEYAGSIGGKAAQWSNKLSGIALGGALTGAATGLRSAAVLTGTRKISNWAENSDSVFASGARLLGVNKIKDSTFDIRNTKVGAKLGTGVSAALGAAGVDVSGVKLGEGSKTKLADQKGILDTIQIYKDKKKDFEKGVQERANKRGERRVEEALKEIEEKEEKEGIKTDNSVFDFTLKTRDASGRINTERRSLETDEEWEKKVKTANQKNKSFISNQKSTYLKEGDKVLATRTFGKNFIARRGLVAEYNARQKYAKQFKDSPETKLRAYTEDLKKPEYERIIGVTADEIDAMNDDQRIALWDLIARDAEKEIKSITLTGDPTLDRPNLEKKRESTILLAKAKNASKKIAELKKKIESEKGDKKEGDKKKKAGD